MGPVREKKVIGDVGRNQWNLNGDHLYELAATRHLRVVNAFGSESSCAWTWLKPGSDKGTRIDYILIREDHARHATQVGPVPSWRELVQGHVDRRPIQARWRLPGLHRLGRRAPRLFESDRLTMRTAYGELASHEMALRMGQSEAPTELACRALAYRMAVDEQLQNLSLIPILTRRRPYAW